VSARGALLVAWALACGPARSPGLPQRDVVDLHVDLPYALHVRGRALADAQASPERLARGRVRVIVTPLFVPNAFAMSPADVRRAYEATWTDASRAFGQLGAEAWLSFEGADGFADDPVAIDPWMTRGACLVGLVHDHTNGLGGASQDPSLDARARGLTAAGKRLAEHVVARGGLLDVAHASDATFDDLAAIARAAGAPLVDSHTGMRALRDTMRNLDDGRLRVVASTGGVIGVSMHGGHVGKTPGESPTLDDVAAAVMHAVAIAGASAVAVGSDFDGGIDPPRAADGEAVWPLLRAKLEAKGLSAAEIDGIFEGNALRVFGWARAHGCVPGAR
jgi:membrane dipeptidase